MRQSARDKLKQLTDKLKNAKEPKPESIERMEKTADAAQQISDRLKAEREERTQSS